MSQFREDHPLHVRRGPRNSAVAACLVGLIVIVFGLTYVKITSGGSLEGFDHAVRPGLAEQGTVKTDG
ncbi:MAG: hypothetical protein AAGD04_12870 [Pseudomonadota bacterium]